jgi:hypothetical protein
VRRIANQANISLLGEEIVRRLRDVFVSFQKGVRTREQMKEMMLRAQLDGGIGFSNDQATVFLKTMDEFLSSTQVLSEQEYADWYTQWQNEKLIAPVIQIAPATSGVSQDDVTQLIAGLPKSRGEASTSLEQGVQLALAEIGPTDMDEFMQRRLVNVISTRLRDVRNADQAKQILLRDQKVGGLGYSVADANRIAGIIEKVYADLRQQILDEEKKRIESTVSEQQVKIEERKKRDSEDHAKWYQEKVRATKMQGSPEEQLAVAFKRMATQQATSPQPTIASGTSKSQMMDVVPPVTGPGVQLTGLTDELGGMTWAEFRRLAKSPEQAAQRILEKLETLKRESFDRWTEGVQAWRQSPLQREYLKLVAESFGAAKPVAQLVEEKRAKDPQLPSSEEIGAIIALNSEIQF